MGDFLSRLVDRALDVAPLALHRRIPSLFERGPDPAVRTGGGEALAELAEETLRAGDAPGIKPHGVTDAPVVQPVPARPRRWVESTPPGSAEESLDHETLRAHEPAPMKRRPLQRPTPVSGPEETAAPPARPERHSAEGGRISPIGKPAVTAEPPATRRRVPAAALAVRETDPRSAHGQEAIPQPAPTPLLHDRGRLLQPLRPDGPPPLVPGLRAALRPALSFERDPSRPVTPAIRPSAPGSRPESPPPPTVQVTIGRIEVRAVSPPSTPSIAPGKPAGPRLTLEDYLRLRDGAER